MSEDFINWKKCEIVLEGLNPRYQTYAMPVFFHGGIYLGLVAIHDQEEDRVWTELTWSPDTVKWNRVLPGTPLIPNSPGKEGEYDWGCVYAAANPVFLEDEIRLYYGGSDGHHNIWRNGFFCLATLRPDGFAGYEQKNKDKPAIITTTPIPYSRQSIQVSADVSKGGSIQVSILGKGGKKIATAKTISESVSDGRLDIMKIKADKVQLRFELNNAKLFSFSFAE